MTSRMPPNPGTASDASFRSQSRLIIDSIKSPTWATTPIKSPYTNAFPHESTGVSSAYPRDCSDDQRGHNREDQSPDGPLHGFMRAERRPELVPSHQPPERVRARVRPLGGRDQKQQRHQSLVWAVKPAKLDDEAPQQPHIPQHEQRARDAQCRPARLLELHTLHHEAHQRHSHERQKDVTQRGLRRAGS